MLITQIELELWDVLDTERTTPEEANLSKVLQVFDLTVFELNLVDFDMHSQLYFVGEAINRITDLFCDRSNALLDELHSRAVKGEPIMADNAFERYVRQSMVVDFDQFIEPLQSLPRKTYEYSRNNYSIVSAVDKEVLLQTLKQENLLSWEEELAQVINTAHTENVSSWIEAISLYVAEASGSVSLADLQVNLQLPIAEIWLGLLLGDFHLEQRQDFYDLQGIWVSLLRFI